MTATTVRPSVEVRTSTQTKAQISPVAMQGLKLLALPVTSLAYYLSRAAEGNPLLELEYCDEGVSLDELGVWKDPREVVTPRKGSSEPSMLSSVKEADFSRLTDACLETESLQMHLLLQLCSRAEHAAEDDSFLRTLIECIDDNGFFAGNLSQLASRAGMDLDHAESLLAELQTFNPAGVAARTPAECLLLQLTGAEPHYQEICGIIQDHLDDLVDNRIPVLMRTYGLTRDELRQVKEQIRSLDPHPGACFSQKKTATYVIPDLFVRCKRQSFEVEVAGDVGVRLVMSKDYVDLIDSQSLNTEDRQWLEERREDAINVLRNIEQRKRTLQRLGTYLVKAQYDFFCFGPEHLKPLTMQQVADALDVHVSTVSRTVQDKHILTPWGCYPLKFFFSSKLETVGPGGSSSCSSQIVKTRIKTIISDEDRAHPFSDAALTRLLNEEGIDIKRRTVSKYRESLGIACQSKRRF